MIGFKSTTLLFLFYSLFCFLSIAYFSLLLGQSDIFIVFHCISASVFLTVFVFKWFNKQEQCILLTY
jgi:hypothetical protein